MVIQPNLSLLKVIHNTVHGYSAKFVTVNVIRNTVRGCSSQFVTVKSYS